MSESGQAGGRRDPEAVATDVAVRLGFLGLFAYWSLSIVAPFVVVVIWAMILAAALYPAQAWLARALGGRPRLASAAVTLAVLVGVIAPTAILATSLVETLDVLRSNLSQGALMQPPLLERLRAAPVVGPELERALTLAQGNAKAFLDAYGGPLLHTGEAVLGAVAGLAGGVLGFAVAVVISGFLYGYGPALVAGGRRFAVRVVGPRGSEFVDLAGATVRGVARGVIGVALIQSLLFGVGVYVAGVPGAGLIALVTLVLGILQLGQGLPTLGVLIWAWTRQDTLPALLLTLYVVPVGFLDNVLKPVLMAKGLPTPMLVILIGLIGGTLAYGMIGLFLGPIVLAVFYELVVSWVRLGDPRSGGIE